MIQPVSEPAGPPTIKAVFFDFGGVVLTSPFEAFNQYEQSIGIPPDSIRTINATNPDNNAWAKFERSDVDHDGFAELFEAEAAAQGFEISGQMVLSLIAGDVRPKMVSAIRKVSSAGLLTACLTNNFRRSGHEAIDSEIASAAASSDDAPLTREQQVAQVMTMFDHVIESSVIGVRKPEPLFYQRALEVTGVEPGNVVFLDDLGINLKPARAMGMTTIKVLDPDVALAELEQATGLSLC